MAAAGVALVLEVAPGKLHKGPVLLASCRGNTKGERDEAQGRGWPTGRDRAEPEEHEEHGGAVKGGAPRKEKLELTACSSMAADAEAAPAMAMPACHRSTERGGGEGEEERLVG